MDDKKTPGTGDGGKGTKYSLKTYLITMLAVVLAVVVLSYFVQQRHSEHQMDTADEPQTQQTEPVGAETRGQDAEFIL